MGQGAGPAEADCKGRTDKAEGKSKMVRRRSRVAQESEVLKRWAEQHGRPAMGAEAWAGAQGKAAEWKC